MKRYGFFQGRFAVVAALLLLLPGAWADIVVLDSGRTLEGIIVRDTEDEVEVSFGVGSVTVARRKVVRLERGTAEERDALRAMYEQQKLERKLREPPDAFLPLDRRLQQLKKDRVNARKAVTAVEGIDKSRAGLEGRERASAKKYRSWSNKLAKLSPRKQYKEYTETVEEVNRAAAMNNESRARLRDNEERKKNLKSSITAYMENLAAFEVDLAQAAHEVSQQQDLQTDERTTNWLVRATAQLGALLGDFQTMHILTKVEGRSQTVSVLINGKVTGTFIVDTGASLITLSASMAKRLGISYAARRPLKLTLADGTVTEGYPVQLQTVQVGEAKARNVQAVVIEKPPAPGVDGLLGMTFLGRFSMRFQAQTGLLELTTFRGLKR